MPAVLQDLGKLLTELPDYMPGNLPAELQDESLASLVAMCYSVLPQASGVWFSTGATGIGC